MLQFVLLQEFHKFIAKGDIRFILTLNSVSTHHSFSPFCVDGGDHENSHAGLTFPVGGSHDTLDAQAPWCTNDGRPLVPYRDRVGAGLLVDGPAEPDRQGFAHSGSALWISDFDRRAAPPLGSSTCLCSRRGLKQGPNECVSSGR